MGSIINMSKQRWEHAFEDWEALLERAHSRDMLEDPKAIWDEAWRQAFMIALHTLEIHKEEGSIEEVILILKRELK